MLEDPSRTESLRKKFCKDISDRFDFVIRQVNALLTSEKVFGDTRESLSLNTRWKFLSSEQKLNEFERWIKTQLKNSFEPKTVNIDWWARYIEAAHAKGAGRTFDEVNKKHSAKSPARMNWYNGTRDQFLSSAFNTPIAIDRLKVLASRTFKDLKGIQEQSIRTLTQVLTDGLVQGKGIRVIAAELRKKLNLSKQRSMAIARTEIIRAHAEGQLNALEAMGIDRVAVSVEWQSAKDGRVCPRCKSMSGKVFSIKQARGMIPAHTNCRCAFAPIPQGSSPKSAKIRKRIEEGILKMKKATKPK